MKSVSMWWRSNFDKERLQISIPDQWKTQVVRMKESLGISGEQITEKIQNPIGCDPIRKMAAGKKTACIAVDDIARPTEAWKLVPSIISELHQAGIKDENIYFVIGMGTHRAYPIADLAKKLSWDIVRRYRVYNHSPYQNNRFIGHTSRGTPLHINGLFLDADFKIGIGCLCPHPLAGFSGGGKIVLPGLASIECVELTLRATLRGFSGRIGQTEGNQVRADINEGAKMAGLNFIVNTVIDEAGGTAGVFAGDPEKAFNAAVPLAREIYACEVPYKNDIGIFNAFPKDIWFLLSLGAMNAWSTRDKDKEVVKEGGTVVIINYASEGQGEHGLMTKGMKQYVMRDQHGTFKDMLKNRNLIFFSPNITQPMIKDYYRMPAELYQDWNKLMARLRELHPENPSVAIFPCGNAQLDRAVLKDEVLV